VDLVERITLGNGSITPPVRRTDVGIARQAAIFLVLAFLTIQALRFYEQSISHLIRDYVEPAWGRLWPNRFWLMLHVAGATLALFTGPFQLWTGLHRRHRTIHRWTGRLYVGGVFVGGATAFYLSAFVEPRGFGVALFSLGPAWLFTVGMAFRAIKQHRIEAPPNSCSVRGPTSIATMSCWTSNPVRRTACALTT
jgi:hypothetical protein